MNLNPQFTQMIRPPDAGQFQQLRRIDRTRADDDVSRRPGLFWLAIHGIGHAGATLAVEHATLGQGPGLNDQIATRPDWRKITMRRAHPAPACDRRLAHDNAILTGAVVIGVALYADFGRSPEDCLVQDAAFIGISDRNEPSRPRGTGKRRSAAPATGTDT